jgi:hypothetical protein
MLRRRFLTGLLLAGASALAAVLLRRRAAARRERADLYFDDGSMVSFVEGNAEAERLLPLARRVLDLAA